MLARRDLFAGILAAVCNPARLMADYKRPVILDPGHGGVDPGTTIGRVHEDEISYDIAVRARLLLVNKGYRVHQSVYDADTRFEPQEILQNGSREYLSHPHGRRRLNRRYLMKRCDAINKAFPREDPVLISIHVDSLGESRSGARIFYPSAEDYGKEKAVPSKRLAERIKEQFEEKNVPLNGRTIFGFHVGYMQAVQDQILRNGVNFPLAIFRYTRPSTKVLIETGNAGNKNDLERLLSSEGRQTIAESISHAV